jgi:predicted nucleic acid-binding protein
VKRLRLYADTSVFGGCFDDEFSEDSRALFEEIKRGKYVLVVSAETIRELDLAPVEVQNLLSGLPLRYVERMRPLPEIRELRDAYLRANVVGPASLSDAEHIASASVGGVDLIVSWNFKHIVHFEKIRGYHAINLLNGYNAIPIHSPKEVVEK